MWGLTTFAALFIAASGFVAALPTTSDATVPQVFKRSISGATGSNCNGEYMLSRPSPGSNIV